MEPARVSTYGPAAAATPRPANRPSADGASFADALRGASDLKVSNHAQKRMDRRQLDLDPARRQRLESAITSAAQKGSRQSVVVIDDLAVVVNIRDRTVVTAMQAEGGRQRVFTNVDSVVIA